MTNAEEAIGKRIRNAGRITFAEFMGLALYGPGGYYTQGQPIGAGGDYYTSPMAHPAFGALLAIQMEQMWRLLGGPATFHLVEVGAGDGTLARDIVAFAQHLDPGFQEALAYVAIDAHSRHPNDGLATRIRWVQSADFPLSGFTGCILSNELIDALPVHRVRTHKGRLQELYVAAGAAPPSNPLPFHGRTGQGVVGVKLAEVWGEPSTAALSARLAADGASLPEGCEGEVSLTAATWMETAAKALARGYTLTIDYGDEADRLYTPDRSRGTVMSYYRHTLQPNPYTRLGRQDITAHANFTTLINAGLAGGLQPVALMTQAELLGNLGLEAFATGSKALPQQKRQVNLTGLRELVKPDGLGNFRVLVQAKGAPAASLVCLGRDPTQRTDKVGRLAALPLPTLSPAHMDLRAGGLSSQQEQWVEGRREDLLEEPDEEV